MALDRGSWTRSALLTRVKALQDAALRGGQATASGDAVATTFSFAHGLTAAPSSVSVVPSSAAARGDFHVTVDATNITVNYAAAPAAGASNLSWFWTARP